VRDGPGYDWPVRISIAPRITGSAPVPVAPGIVVIPTGTPEPHNQMIFVRLADGREYLFAGQVAPTASAWLRQRGRPRLRTDHYLPEDRQEALAWLHTIRQLRRNDPGLRIIPGVDFAAAAGPRSGTGITVGFPGRAEPPQVAGKP